MSYKKHRRRGHGKRHIKHTAHRIKYITVSRGGIRL